MKIKTVTDQRRGCGWRKPGGLYLVSDEVGSPCCQFPIELRVCPTCHAGIKPSRGWTWVDIQPFLKKCANKTTLCPLNVNSLMGKSVGRVGLLWIGEGFYKTTEQFMNEAHRLGISRRIKSIPKGFELGVTWVALAHRHPTPHIFYVFKPRAVEYIVRGDESPKQLASLIERDITPVVVKHAGEQMEMGIC